MSLWQLIVRQIQQRSLSSALTSLSVALGVMLVTGILILQDQMERHFLKPGEGYSIVVGAPGSALQLVLNAVYHMDKSPGLMPMRKWLELEQDDSVAMAVPYALGDSFRGFRVVATTDALFSSRFPHPEGEGAEKLAEGRPFRFDRERLFEQLRSLGARGLPGDELDEGADGQDAHDHGDEHAHEDEHADEHAQEDEHAHGDEHGHEDEHAHDEEHAHEDQDEHEHEHADQHDDHEHAHEHEHDDEHAHEDEHEHEHDDHEHEHGDEHDDEHDDHEHEHEHEHDDEHDEHDHGEEHDHGHDHGAHGVFEAVLGAEVARSLGVPLGAEIEPTHGVEGGHAHDHEHFWKVVGILKPTGTPVDKVVFINLDSFFAIDEHAGGALIPDTNEAGLSSVLVFPRPGAHKVMLLSRLNREPEIQVADVHEQIRNLFSIVGSVDVIFLMVSILVVFLGVLSILVAIYNTMNERRREVAILRAIGASRKTVLGAIVGEAALLTARGALLGVILGHMLVAIASSRVEEAAGFRPDALTLLPVEALVVLVVVAGGALAGLVPALKAYRTDVAANLKPLS